LKRVEELVKKKRIQKGKGGGGYFPQRWSCPKITENFIHPWKSICQKKKKILSKQGRLIPIRAVGGGWARVNRGRRRGGNINRKGGSVNAGRAKGGVRIIGLLQKIGLTHGGGGGGGGSKRKAVIKQLCINEGKGIPDHLLTEIGSGLVRKGSQGWG